MMGIDVASVFSRVVRSNEDGSPRRSVYFLYCEEIYRPWFHRLLTQLHPQSLRTIMQTLGNSEGKAAFDASFSESVTGRHTPDGRVAQCWCLM